MKATMATLLLATTFGLTGCASLLHTGPMAEINGAKVDKYDNTAQKDSDALEAGNAVKVEDGSNVQSSASANIQSSTNIQGDGWMMVIKDNIPWICGTILLSTFAFSCRNVSIKIVGPTMHIEGSKNRGVT